MKRLDNIPGTDLKIYQDPEKFSYGIDAILISEFVESGNVGVDLGTGTGIIALRVLARKNYKKIYAIEIQKEMADMAKSSVKYNNLENKIKILNKDIKDIECFFEKASVDTVFSNPPYIKAGSGIVNLDENKLISRKELKINLEEIIKASDYLLKPLGKLFLVHRPNRLVDIFFNMRKYNIEPKYIEFIKPNKSKMANLVLIKGVKGAGEELKIGEVIVYDENGEYTEEIKRKYYGE